MFGLKHACDDGDDEGGLKGNQFEQISSGNASEPIERRGTNTKEGKGNVLGGQNKIVFPARKGFPRRSVPPTTICVRKYDE